MGESPEKEKKIWEIVREKKDEKKMEYMSKIGNRGVGIYGMIRHDKTQLSLFLLCVFYAVHL